MERISQSVLNEIVEKTVLKKKLQGVVFQLGYGDSSYSLISAAGNLRPGSLYYIASINKLILSAIALRCIREGKLGFSDKLACFMNPADLKGLHVFKGKDYSEEITVEQLMSNTSGLPCYLTDKVSGKEKTMSLLQKGKDEPWPLNRVLELVKSMGAKYIPGERGKAHYANTNFRLLALVLEKTIEKPVSEILTDLFEELEMKRSFVLRRNNNPAFTPVYLKETPVLLPEYWASSGFDIVSDAQDQMKFLKRFFKGYFFPEAKMKQLQKWNSIFFPFKYGTGIQKFYTPRVLSPFKPVPDLVGHCGSTGTAAFYIPGKKVFITGATNQVNQPHLLFQTLIKIIRHLD